MKFKKKNIKILTDDFWYDLTDGGDIKIEELLEDEEEIKTLKQAISIVSNFELECLNQGIIEYM